MRPLILAETVDEPDFVAEGWSKEYEKLGPEDYETFCRGGNGLQGGYDSDPERDVNMQDVWGIDCYVRKNLQWACEAVRPASLRRACPGPSLR